MSNLKQQLDIKVVALLLILIVGGGGYLFYKKSYTPAKLALAGAQSSSTSATTALQAAQTQLAATHKQGPDNSAYATTMLAQDAIPQDPQVAEAMLEAQSIAKVSGVTIQSLTPSTSAGGAAAAPVDPTDPASTASAAPNQMTMAVAGFGTYPEMLVFLQKVQEGVQTEGTGSNQKVYITGREFSVSQFQVGSTSGSSTATSASTDSASGAVGGVMKPGDLPFTVTLTMYSRNSSNAAASAVPADGTATATDGTATGTAAPAADGTTPAATGTAAGTTPAATTPATGTAPAAGATDATANTGTAAPAPTTGATS